MKETPKDKVLFLLEYSKTSDMFHMYTTIFPVALSQKL